MSQNGQESRAHGKSGILPVPRPFFLVMTADGVMPALRGMQWDWKFGDCHDVE